MRKIKNILLVDDDFASNYLTEIILKDMNFADSISTVRDGKAAINYMTSCTSPQQTEPAVPCPDLILLDINMPVMDGFEFLEEYKQLLFERKEDVLIILLTTSTNNRDIEKAKKYKVNGYIEKPISEEKLKQVLHPYKIVGL